MDNNLKVAARLYEAKKQNEKTLLHTYYCTINDCPLLKSGKCINLGMFSSCVYGGVERRQTKTKRSKSYYKDLNELREIYKDFPNTQAHYTKCMEYIGEYVYLPYLYMDMSQSLLIEGYEVPFVRNSCLFINGIPFLKKTDFTPEMVVNICKMRPHALFGGEITNYQRESVPLFLLHLQLKDKQLFDEAAKLDPSILSKTQNIDCIEYIDCKYGELKKATSKDEIYSPKVKIKLKPTQCYNLSWQEDDTFSIWGEWEGLIFLTDIKTTNNYFEMLITLDDTTMMRVFDKKIIVKLLQNNPNLYSGK